MSLLLCVVLKLLFISEVPPVPRLIRVFLSNRSGSMCCHLNGSG